MKKLLFVLPLIALLSGCVTAPPRHANNICSVFMQYPKWYWAAQASQKRWGVPISVQMAFIYHESSFHAKAKPRHNRILWVIPWFGRVSSSYGYTQSLRGTWRLYKHSTGNHGASRNNFADATDFVGWFGALAHRRAGIPLNNAYDLYLAYHEGIGGYQHRTYLAKPWLLPVASSVARRAHRYHLQLVSCQRHLKQHHWWDVF